MIVVLSMGQTVYKKRVTTEGGFSKPVVSHLEGKIVKMGRKYVYAETTWSGQTVTWKIPLRDLMTQDRYSEYFLDLDKFKRDREEVEAEGEILSFVSRNMGADIRRLSHEEKMIIRDILRKHKEEIRL